MSRRSARLVSGGYYHSDEDSDSSSVTNVSYRESPTRVFKKKPGSRKSASRTSSRANSTASLTGAETPPTADQHNETEQTVVSVPFVATTSATPRPAITPARSRSQTPCHSQVDVPKESRAAGLYSSSRPGGHNTPHTQEMNQNSIDSSGYSSSEGRCQRPTSAKGDGTSNIGHSTAYLSPTSPNPTAPLAEIAQARVLTDLANASLSPGGKKAACLLLFLIIALLSIWFLFPWLACLMPRRTIFKTQTQAEPRKQPLVPPLPLSPPTNARPLIPTVDPAIVSAAVEKKMQGVLEEILLKQDNLYSQLEEKMQLDMRGVRARMEAKMQLDMRGVRASMEAADSDSRLRLDKEVAALRTQIEEYQTHSHTASDSLNHRLDTMEEGNIKLSQELLSIQVTPPPPPPAPCPEPVTTPLHHNQLTPELQQAMEKWLLDRMKDQDMNGAVGEEISTGSDCGRPMADKMADFALETQGASVVSTKCSETYRMRSACVTLFGFPLWYPSESPRTVIQGYPVLLPGKCWAFHGVQGILVLSLSHPVRITHVTVDHLPRCNSPTGRIDSAPKDFQVYGMVNDTEEGALLGQFTYNEDGESTQTFELPDPTHVVYRFVELRVLSNWGHMEYTCLYRFRVHGKIAST